MKLLTSRMTTVATHTTVTAIIPARNEEGNIAAVVEALLRQTTPSGHRLITEIIVADNGSTDRTAALAQAAGATVVFVPVVGYGGACWHASEAAHGDVLLFVDGDTVSAGLRSALEDRNRPVQDHQWDQLFRELVRAVIV